MEILFIFRNTQSLGFCLYLKRNQTTSDEKLLEIFAILIDIPFLLCLLLNYAC